MKNCNLSNLLSLTAALALFWAAPVRAADTTEPFDIGASDVDLYMGYDGVGLGRDERAINGEIMLGYGVIENLSAFLGTALSGDESLASQSASLYFGVFSTLFESDHVDLDLSANVAGQSGDASGLSVTPSLELNIDQDPELNRWGLYLRAGLPVFGREDEAPPEAEPTGNTEPADSEVVIQIECTAGAYYTVAEGNQLLLEYDMGFLPDTADGERSVDVGSLAFGHNLAVSEALELINQLAVDIPQPGETASIGFMTGFIATVPAAASPVAAPAIAAEGNECSPQTAASTAKSERSGCERL